MVERLGEMSKGIKRERVEKRSRERIIEKRERDKTTISESIEFSRFDPVM